MFYLPIIRGRHLHLGGFLELHISIIANIWFVKLLHILKSKTCTNLELYDQEWGELRDVD